MGQQQLLLLVLAVVLVGLAAVAGIQALGEGKDRARRDLRMVKVVDVATRIQAWSRAPSAMGGGTTPAGVDWTRFRLEAIGVVGTQVNGVNWRWESRNDGMGCFLIFINPSPTDNAAGTRVHLHLLDEACTTDSWQRNPALLLSGENLGDIRWVTPPY